MRDLVGGPRRFVDLQRVLPGISTEQLRSRLNRMVADGLLTRERYREVPPRVEYGLTPRSRDLLPVIAALARWGCRWAWSPPRSGESVQIGAILRSAPGLSAPQDLSGSVEIVVERASRPEECHVLTAQRGVMTYEERAAPDADAHVVASQDAWIEAFSPDPSREGLVISGDATLAERMLDFLGAEALPRAAVA